MPTVTPLGRLKSGGRERNRTSRRVQALTPFRAELLVRSDPYLVKLAEGAEPIPQAAGAAGRRGVGRVVVTVAAAVSPILDIPSRYGFGGRREARTPTGFHPTGLANRRDEPIFACLPLRHAVRCTTCRMAPAADMRLVPAPGAAPGVREALPLYRRLGSLAPINRYLSGMDSHHHDGVQSAASYCWMTRESLPRQDSHLHRRVQSAEAYF